MADAIDLAILANAAYRDIRGIENRPVLTTAWDPPLSRTQFGITGTPHRSGFSAEVFRNSTTQEIVISYQGTNPDEGDDYSRDWSNNHSLFQAAPVDQLLEAALTYARGRKENPSATITLTGHSLGGGLASLVAVYFGESATLFV